MRMRGGAESARTVTLTSTGVYPMCTTRSRYSPGSSERNANVPPSDVNVWRSIPSTDTIAWPSGTPPSLPTTSPMSVCGVVCAAAARNAQRAITAAAESRRIVTAERQLARTVLLLQGLSEQVEQRFPVALGGHGIVHRCVRRHPSMARLVRLDHVIDARVGERAV